MIIGRKRKVRKIFLLAVSALLAIGLFLNFLGGEDENRTDPVVPFITANPFNLSQINAISQYRSCEGHNYSGYNAQGEEETYRTMKHYIEPAEELARTVQQVKIYAPFDGRVSQIRKDSRGSQVYLSPTADSGGWDFLYFHVDLLPDFDKRGAKFTSGEHIGFANLAGAANFDISMKSFGSKQRHGSPFHFMTEEVLAQYSDVGVTMGNIIIAKEERDANPCKLAPGQSGRDAFYDQSESGKSRVRLTVRE